MSKRVLLIDDDARLVTALKIRLVAAGYEVLTAFNGDDGISDAALFRPDAIVLDVRMPKMDGYEVCQLIRAVPDLRETPVIILSATAGENGILEAGGDVFLRKPYRAPELLALLEEVMVRRCVS